VIRIEIRFRRPGTRDTSVAETAVAAVRRDTQEPFLNERVEDRRTHRPIDAAETMHLIHRQLQSGHFEEFSSEAFKDLLHINLAQRDAIGV